MGEKGIVVEIKIAGKVVLSQFVPPDANTAMTAHAYVNGGQDLTLIVRRLREEDGKETDR